METRDRWLYAWAMGYTAVGAASLLVPLYAISLGGGALAVGVLASTAAFAGVPGAILWGWLAARTGRRRVFVVIALAAAGGVLAVVPFVEAIPVLVVANALLWFVVAAAGPVLNLLVVDGVPEAQWESRIALLNTYQGYGWVAGLVLGSVWTPAGAALLGPLLAQRSFFWACGAIALLGVPLAARWLPTETTVTPEQVTREPDLLARLDRGAGRYVRTVPFATTRLYWALRGIDLGRVRSGFSRRLWAYLLAVCVFSAGFAAFWGPLPAYLGASFADQAVFPLFLASNAAAAVSYTRAGTWASRQGAGRLQARALAARVVLFPLVAGVGLFAATTVEFAVLLAVFGLIGLTWAVIAVTATVLVVRLGGPARASALGVYAALAGIGGGVGSIAGGLVASRLGYLVAFSLAALLVLAGLAVVLALERRRA